VIELTGQYPDLAERFVALRDGLAVSTPDTLALERREMAEALESVVAEIRARPGFADFLRPSPVGRLAVAASDGPIAIINVSRFGSHALLLTRNGAEEPVPLPDLTPDRVRQQVIDFLTALDETQASADAEQRLTAALEWLWDAVTGPVLDILGLFGPPTDVSWPRLWWCVPGLLSLLPLHAAGYHLTRFDAAPRTVLDRAVSSYTPTIKALIHARRGRPGAGSGRIGIPEREGEILAVAMGHTPDAPDLPGAEGETDALRQLLPERVLALVGAQATHDGVIEALRSARWVHFACHGSADPASPSRSHLLLYDHVERPLTTADVAHIDLGEADLAFMSACYTARTALTDEAIHLASAFQLAGYRHVIGTLWPIRDYVAVRLTRDFYAGLVDSGTAETAAFALHAATRRMRDRSPLTPSVWASHIHSGP